MASLDRIELDGFISSNDTSITTQIIEDARTIHSNRGRRSETMFFKVVTGGATSVASEVLDTLQNSSTDADDNLYGWLTHDSGSSGKADRSDPGYKLLKYLILVPLWVISTPFFYAFHRLINSILNSKNIASAYSMSQYERLDFTLVFAVFSGNMDMIKLFLEHGVNIDLKDGGGNNVVHYLADLSARDLPRATDCYSLLWNMVESGHIPKETLQKMITYEENVNMQNAIEYTCQFGSLKLACQMINDTMTTNTMTIVGSNVILAEKDDKSKASNSNLTQSVQDACNKFPSQKKLQRGNNNNDEGDGKSMAGWIVKRLSITPYTAYHRHGFVSHLLHLLSARPTTSISGENWVSVQQDSGMQRWMKLKFKQWIWPIGITMVLEWIVTLVLVLGMLVNNQGDMLLTPNKQIFVKKHIQIFLSSWKQNQSLTGENQIALRSEFFSKYPDLEEALKEPQKGIDYVEILQLIRNLDGYNLYSLANFTSLYNEVCVTGSIYQQVGDLIQMDNCTTPAANGVLENCAEPQAKYPYYFTSYSWDPYELAIASSFIHPIFKDRRSIFRNILRMEMSRAEIFTILFILTAYFCIYIILDIYCRTATLVKQIASNVTVYSIFATPLQGSYTKGQCKVFPACAYLLLIFYYYGSIEKFYSVLTNKTTSLQEEILTYDRLVEDNITTNFVMSAVLLFMLVCRAVLHLNALRLFPWIGTFVITTFEMAADLFQFTIIYLVIVFIFSTLFHLVSRDPTCPIFRDSNNYYVIDSIFNTFALTFGHANIEFSNASLKVVYAAFVVMSIILLLNLIIAVMSSTAAYVTVDPWATQLYQEALITEALGIEHWLLTLFPSFALLKWSLKRAGFIIESNRESKETEVFIDIFEPTK